MKRFVLVAAALAGLACSGLPADLSPAGGAPAEPAAANGAPQPPLVPSAEAAPAAPSPALSPAPAAGTSVGSTRYGYRLTLPVGYPAPTAETTDVPTAIGNISTEMLTSCAPSGTCVMANGASYPDVAFTAQTIDTMLDGARDGAVTNVGGTLGSETRITVDGNPGRDFQVSAVQAGMTFYVRAVIVVKRPNLVMVQWLSTDPAGRTSPEANAMFSSLTVNATSP